MDRTLWKWSYIRDRTSRKLGPTVDWVSSPSRKLAYLLPCLFFFFFRFEWFELFSSQKFLPNKFSYREDFRGPQGSSIWVYMLFFICYNLENKTQKTGAPNDRFISNNLLSYVLISILEFINAFFQFPENLRSSRLSENDSLPFSVPNTTFLTIRKQQIIYRYNPLGAPEKKK